MGASFRSVPTCVKKRSRAWESMKRSRRASPHITFAAPNRSGAERASRPESSTRTTRPSGIRSTGVSASAKTSDRRASRGFRSARDSGRRCSRNFCSSRPCSWTASSSPIPRQGRWTPTAWRPTATPTRIPEHATEYELGFSHLFSSTSNLDVSIYRSNLRDTIENFYPGGGAQTFCNSKLGFAYEIPINIGNAVYEGAEARYKQRFPRQNLTMTLSYGLNVAYPYALGPWVSNPTSGGTLVDSQQFLGVPQQQGSAVFTWAQHELARVDRVYLCRQQQHAQPAALHALRSGGRQEFRPRRYHRGRDKYLQLGGRPVHPLRCRHALSGIVFDLEQRPVPGQLSHRCIVRPTGIGKVHRHPSHLNA